MRIGLLLTALIIAGNCLTAQTSDRMSRSEYFETYEEMAVHEMQRSGVPASITLAQGALESGDGNSRLARIANNHFGIKCHNDWNGKTVYEDDDAKNECFRKYHSAEDSYRDHSDYLLAKSRYAFLFELDVTDYKGWARGLKKAGYATSSTYADKLISIIEEFNLQKYDRMDGSTRKQHNRNQTVNRVASGSERAVLERNRVKYILAREGDTYESITSEFGKISWEIPRYNDTNPGSTLFPGQVVFIQPKRNKAEAGNNIHRLKPGETMYTVSQLYAVKLSALYTMNQLKPGVSLSEGTILQLRKTLKGQLRQPELNEAPQGGEEEEEIRIELNLE